ncbi:MAG: murein biosynthesis integral membrane protein MurJ [Acidimicrobiia bacterium]|nr:murein biosynthesis integral membrane protein MurJ [Acidimicrobiia bacterium]
MKSGRVGLGTAAAIVSGSVLLSRLLGLLRETLLAALLGVTAEGDVYRYAFLLPDLLNYLLAGGFLSITLIPLLARRSEEGNELQTQVDFTAVFRWVAAGIIVLTAALMVGTEPIARLAFGSLAESDLAEVVRLTRIVLPAQVCFVLGSLFMAFQYVQRRFLLPALAPLIYNLGIILGGVVTGARAEDRADGFIWGALGGAVIGNLLLQWFGAARAGLRFTRGPSKALPAYLALAFPLMIGQSVAVLDEQFPRLFGQLAEDGATTALSLARMLNMLPVGIIAQAAAVASFPFLARLVAARNEPETERLTDRALRGSTVASFLALALVVGASRPLVSLVYEWGRFATADTDVVSGLLVVFGFAIPAWAIHQVLSRWFYAHERVWRPVIIGTAATVIAIPLSFWFFDLFGVTGIALASTAVMWIYTIALAASWTKGRGDRWQGLASLVGRVLVPAAAAAWGVRLLVDQAPDSGPVVRLLTCVVAGLVGIGIFSLLGRALRLEEASLGWWRGRS